MRYEIGKWIEGVKGAGARQRRAEQMAERLMLTMEGEKIPPPILEVAFQKNPAALRGWKAMTAAQRRGHLLGVFYSTRALRLVKSASRSLLRRLFEPAEAELKSHLFPQPSRYTRGFFHCSSVA